MQLLINSYQCEWTTVIRDPKRRDHFKEFVNGGNTQPVIEMVKERDQSRPVNWPKDVPNLPTLSTVPEDLQDCSWILAGPVSAFPSDQGKTVLYGDVQVAVFHKSTGDWYATQNMCPHKRALVLSSGILGSVEGQGGQEESYVSCPMHKVSFQNEHRQLACTISFFKILLPFLRKTFRLKRVTAWFQARRQSTNCSRLKSK
jgi:nitrite reductase (NAD(P)H)